VHRSSPHSPLRSAAVLAVAAAIAFSAASSHAALPPVADGDVYESPFAKVFERVAPAVVKVVIRGVQESRRGDSPWFFVPQDNKRQRPYSGMGSGVVIDRDGHVITNNHVIVKPDGSSVADNILVVFSNNEEYDAEVVGRDPETDIAVIRLKLDGKTLPESYVARLGDSDTIKPGDYAIAIGNPLGLERTITVGVISATGRYEKINPRGAGNLRFKDFIQTDALINPGNSGGALCDIEGNVIGINDMYIANSGIGFAIPSNLAKNVAAQIIETGFVKRGAVGVQIEDVSRENQEDYDLPDRDGAIVMAVFPGTPAAYAGLKAGDVIISINGEKLKNSNDFMLKVGELPPGAVIQLAVIQDGAIRNMNLTLADREVVVTAAEQWRGIHVADIGSSPAMNFDIGTIDTGVVVVKIAENSPAADTSLEEGDVIVEINNEPVDNVSEFLELRDKYSESKKPILLYRLRKQPNGRIEKGFVAVKS